MAIIAHYALGPPANCDIRLIRARAKRRGVLSDVVPELHFKGLLLRDSGQHGATANSYSSVYLWRQDKTLRNFLVTGRYETVTDSFGRAEIRTRFALNANLRAASAREIERNNEVAERAGTAAAAAAAGIDTLSWKFTRILVATNEPAGADRGVACEILHLARLLPDTLPEDATR
jgi:hypothetical protein